MTHEEKINYMRISAGIACMGFTNKQLDLLVTIYEHVIDKEGKGTISDIVEIEDQVKRRANQKHKRDILDKISDTHS